MPLFIFSCELPDCYPQGSPFLILFPFRTFRQLRALVLRGFRRSLGDRFMVFRGTDLWFEGDRFMVLKGTDLLYKGT